MSKSKLLAVTFLILSFGFILLTNNANTGTDKFGDRGDIRNLPAQLKQVLSEINGRPHSFQPLTVFAEADKPSQLFGYYLLDSSRFEPNIFTATFPGINDGMIPTATGANHDLPVIASVRLVLEPKPGLPTDPADAESFIDIFTDISGLFVINNESGWYEGWMIHDLRVPKVAPPRGDGHAQFGKMTQADAAALAAMGSGNNVPGHFFTTDGKAVQFPAASDHFPDRQTNLVPIHLSMGAYNSLQQSDAHSYWEFNEYTNWVHPLYEIPFTGGILGTFEKGQIGEELSVIPGSGPAGVSNSAVDAGDNPNLPRDPDRLHASSPDDADRPMQPDEDHAEERLRFVPSGLAKEIMLDVYVRVASFKPSVKDFSKRLFAAYAAEVARIDENNDGIVELEEGDVEEESDGQSNERLYIPATQFNRFAVTREINDGILAPRFAPSQRAWVLTGFFVHVKPAVAASVPRDNDDR
jgi:hypothetical protein